MPRPTEIDHDIRIWDRNGVAFERHRYAPGPAGELPLHVHDEYQFCFCPDFPGEYTYRRARHGVPLGGLTVIHPGEVHAARDPAPRSRSTTFDVVYAAPSMVRDVLADADGSPTVLPFMPCPIILDRETVAAFRLLFGSGTCPDLAFWARLTGLIERVASRHAEGRPGGGEAVLTGDTRIRRVVELIRDRYSEDLSLAELAGEAELNPHYLTRVFTRSVGMPPHAFQLAVRVDHGKEMLRAGRSIASVARATGFSDQSHFHRHFRRYVGAPPGRYASSTVLR